MQRENELAVVELPDLANSLLRQQLPEFLHQRLEAEIIHLPGTPFE